MSRLLLLAAAGALLGAPAVAQTPDPLAGHAASPAASSKPAADLHAGHGAPAPQPAATPDPHAGHTMPAALAPPAADPLAGHDTPTSTPAGPAADPHAGHGMSAAPAEPHAGHAMPPATPTAAELPVGSEPPPPPPADAAADRVYGAAAMDRARGVLGQEHGGARYSKVMLNMAEARLGSAGGYHWDVEAWYGGDTNRLVLKSEGEGGDHGLEDAEVQALWSRAIAPYTDLQVGVRHDVRPRPSRTYLTVGVESLFPYWFDAEAALFLSDEGDLLGRLEGSYDFRLTQRAVLQPRAELNLAAQDVAETGTGSGLSDAELGLRLRYEIRREFAPYVGVAWSRKFGETADFARAEGEDVDETRVVIGLRAWF